MLAQQAVARTRKPTTRKVAPPTIVQVQPADVAAGLYGALSSAGDRWYTVNVAERTCTCPAGLRHFEHCSKGACKHMLACRVVARALASMTPSARAVALRLQNIRVHVERVDLAVLNAPLACPLPRPAGVAAGMDALPDTYPTAA